jgi:hypothetical protein
MKSEDVLLVCVLWYRTVSSEGLNGSVVFVCVYYGIEL